MFARNRLRLCALLFSAVLLVASLAPGCHPQPPAPDGIAVTPGSWTSTARTVLTTLRWAVPAARMVTNVLLDDPARSIVGRALDAVTDAAGRLDTALGAYEARGGDRCAAKAAVAGVRSALVSTAQVLVDHGIALGVVLERVVDTAAALVDELVPGCDPDAGWASAGAESNRELRAMELLATTRGIILRRDLDRITPPDGGAR